MIDYHTALALIQANTLVCRTETVAIDHAIGSVAAMDIYTQEASPRFNTSGMDGFAIKSASTVDASQAKPLAFSIIQTIAAGDTVSIAASKENIACEIMTGAPIPEGFDTVIPIEAVTQQDNNTVLIYRPANIHDNIRLIGADFITGDTLLKKGETITEKHIMVFSAMGIPAIKVYKKPRIAILCTGKELVNPTAKALQPGQIRNASGPYLKAALEKMGCTISYYHTVDDNTVTFLSCLDTALSEKPDILLTTGAVSVGKWDFIPRLLKDLNAEIFFHRVRIKPGKPIVFANIPQGPHFFGLPGNPISTVIGLDFFVIPFINLSLNKTIPKAITATSLSKGTKGKGFRHFLKAIQTVNDIGKTEVSILDHQESFKISSYLKANCWAMLDEDCEHYNVGDLIKVYL